MNARTAPLPPADLADPIWTIEHLALALRLQARATRAVVARPGFPAPIRLTASPKARSYWLREQVLAYLTGLSGTAPATAPAPTDVPTAGPATAVPATRPGPARRIPTVRPAPVPTPVPTEDDQEAAARAELAALRAAAMGA
ncbi:hypothetical protein [Puerhibacterium sp. TATVAM-FAB25]|uniref:hypothetical protein n=1 Tax=Puerhibacterium sp. TATVAM-FAB25 TaxID=3093699 RepID=UPI00397AFA38